MRCPDVEAIVFNGHALDVVAELSQLCGQHLADGSFHSGGGLDVDELAGESENVHSSRIDDFRNSLQKHGSTKT